MKLIRLILRWLILTLDRFFPPREIPRTAERQKELKAQTAGLILYQLVGCPFCVKVRRKIRELGLTIELRDVRENKEYENELLRGGGVFQVPCLRIPAAGEAERDKDVWLYESSEINRYLTERFGS